MLCVPIVYSQDFPRFHHVSTGDLLRRHVREKTELGREAKSYMDNGDLVPDRLMIDLVMDDAKPYLDEDKCLLLVSDLKFIDMVATDQEKKLLQQWISLLLLLCQLPSVSS